MAATSLRRSTPEVSTTPGASTSGCTAGAYSGQGGQMVSLLAGSRYGQVEFEELRQRTGVVTRKPGAQAAQCVSGGRVLPVVSAQKARR